MNNKYELQTYSWDGIGYMPQLRTSGWMAAILNWEEIMERDKALNIESHPESDEVFILLNGNAAMYLVEGDAELRVVELSPHKLYNVPRGTWHNVLASKDVKFAIIENDGTDQTGTVVRALTDTEKTVLHHHIPSWLGKEKT